MNPAVVFGMAGVFALLGSGFLFLGMRNLSAARASRLWPSTSGKVTSSQLMIGGPQSSRWYRAQVAYTFAVNGQSYMGEKVFFGDSRFRSRGKPESVVER